MRACELIAKRGSRRNTPRRCMENNESMTRAVLDFVASMTPEEAVARERELNVKLVPLAAGLQQVQSMWLLNRTGQAIASSRFFPAPKVDASDREYFRWHQAGRGGVYISEPLVSRTTGETFFDVSRRWEQDNKFAGVVSISLYPAYFSEFYRGMALDEPGVVVMMARNDGEIIARWPAIPEGKAGLDTDSALARRWRPVKCKDVLRGFPPSMARTD